MPHIQIHSRLRHRHSILQILLTALVLARPAWPSRLAWVFGAAHRAAGKRRSAARPAA